MSSTETITLDPKEAEARLAALVNAPEPAPIIRPNDGSVTLPGGIVTADGTVSTSAEVRELNGADEEAIYKHTDIGKAMLAILKRAVVSVNNTPVTPDILDKLLSGDRETLLVAIRVATFGEEVVMTAMCPSCMETHSYKVSIVDDVTTKTVDLLQDQTWELELSKGQTAIIKLPDGKLQTTLFESANKTSQELNTLIIGGCLVSIDGVPAMGAKAALKMSIKDRETVVRSIFDKSPGPRLGEVSKPCLSCGETIPLPLSIPDIFRL